MLVVPDRIIGTNKKEISMSTILRISFEQKFLICILDDQII